MSTRSPQYVVVDGIKVGFDVALDKPLDSVETALHLGERRMTASVWPEPVGKIRECWLVDTLKQHAHDFLYQFVVLARERTSG
jgi:hypothetical protein